MHVEEKKDTRYGFVAEFEDSEDLIRAARSAREAGYKRMEGYSPFPVHGLSEAIGFRDNRVPWIVFLAGVTGGTLGYALQYYVSVIDYPMNVGGKGLNSVPNFVPVTFECTI